MQFLRKFLRKNCVGFTANFFFKMPPKGKGKGKPAGPGGPGEEAKAGEKISEVDKKFLSSVCFIYKLRPDF